MVLTRDEIRALYRRTASVYDAALVPYRLAEVERYRKELVGGLGLRLGGTAVDLGCGTGANLPYLVEAVGPEGRVVGVDLSEAMLARARRYIQRKDWRNVELIETDVTAYELPPGTAGVAAAFSLEMVPEYDDVIGHIAVSLRPGARLGLLGLKHPERWPEWLVSVGIRLNKPFGVSRDYESFRPWTSVERHMQVVRYQELYLGAAYLCIGEVGVRGGASGDRRPRRGFSRQGTTGSARRGNRGNPPTPRVSRWRSNGDTRASSSAQACSLVNVTAGPGPHRSRPWPSGLSRTPPPACRWSARRPRSSP